MRALALPALAILATVAPCGAQDAREADHQDLRRMLVSVRDAINTQHIEKMEPLMAEHFSIVLADGELITDLKVLKAYYGRLLDPGSGVLTSLTINPAADELTQFIADDVGVCHGTSSDTFVLRSGKTRVLQSRWTATLVKRGGAWKIVALQAGANILDNPILEEHKSLAKLVALGGSAAGIVLVLVAFAAGRRAGPKPAA
jgi:hypothetical protein